MRPGAQLDFWKTTPPFMVHNKDIYSVVEPNHEKGRLDGGVVSIERPRYVSTLHTIAQQRFEEKQEATAQPGDQLKAFDHVIYDRGKVQEMFASRTHGAHTMTLLGAAALDHKNRYGALPGVSKSLSRHSAPIVQRAVDRGLVDNPTSKDDSQVRVTNDEKHASPQEMSRALAMQTAGSEGRASRMTASQVTAGRSFVRGAFRTQKPPRTAEFEQGRLF